MNYYAYVCLLLSSTVFLYVHAYDEEMTVHIDAGKKECFYHTVPKGEVIEVEYQVIDGGHGDLDISFSLTDPTGRIIVSEYKKPENVHRHDANIEGDYSFCFDNSFSSFNRKTVFFDLIVERDGEQNAGDDQWNEAMDGLTPEEFYDMKVQDIMDYIGRIRMQMTKARQLQDLLRSNEARDRNKAEENFFKVNAWSFFQVMAMIGVGLLQVLMVRSIFETETRLSKIWHKIGM